MRKMRDPDCPQPLNNSCPVSPRDDNEPVYCLCDVYREARQRCIDKGEGWRWGVGTR